MASLLPVVYVSFIDDQNQRVSLCAVLTAGIACMSDGAAKVSS